MAQENVDLNVIYKIPDVGIFDLQPVSQLSNPSHLFSITPSVKKNLLVMGKQATFRFNYTYTGLPYPVKVRLRLMLPKNQWEWHPTNQVSMGGCFCVNGASPSSVCPYFFNSPEKRWRIVYFRENSDYYILEEDMYLDVTQPGEQETAILLGTKFWGKKGLWFPKPTVQDPTAILQVVTIGKVDREDIPQYETLHLHIAASFHSPVRHISNLKLGFFIMNLNAFTPSERRDIIVNFPSGFITYLEGSFPIRIKAFRWLGYVEPVRDVRNELSRRALEIQEEVIEADVHRAIVIVPHNYLNPIFEGGKVGGVVFHSASMVAFVDYDFATDSGNYEYFPVVAHELSHTFGYPDIYFGCNFPADLCTTCTYYGYNMSNKVGDWPAGEPPNKPCSGSPRVPGYYAFFDERKGGLISFHHPRSFDIMDCFYGDSWVVWPYHSWSTVWRESYSFDPPEGLLVSLIVYSNETVFGRPFTRVYNHSQPFLSENGTGNYELLLLSRSGEVLARYPVNISFGAYDVPNFEAETAGLVGVVKWFNDLGEIRLINSKGKTVFMRRVSEHTPTVSIVYPINGMKLKRGKTYTFKWIGNDEDGDELWYNVHLRGKGEQSWSILAHRTQSNSLSLTIPVNADRGVYELLVKATDGVNTGFSLIKVEIVGELPVYSVIAKSNIGVEVKGSGAYEEGENVTLKAPLKVPMKGLYGLLGGVYVFEKWSGFIDSQENPVSFVAHAKQKTIEIEAVYREDTSSVMVALTAIILIIVILIVAVILWRRKRNL